MWSFLLQNCCHVPMAQRIAFPARVKKFLRNRIYGNDYPDVEQAFSYIKLVNLHDVGTMETLFLPTRSGLPDPESPILQLISFDYNHFCSQNSAKQNKVYCLMQNIPKGEMLELFHYVQKVDIQNILAFGIEEVNYFVITYILLFFFSTLFCFAVDVHTQKDCS